jgi:hypothetical protein
MEGIIEFVGIIYVAAAYAIFSVQEIQKTS